jgi:hypothetical protein
VAATTQHVIRGGVAAARWSSGGALGLKKHKEKGEEKTKHK